MPPSATKVNYRTYEAQARMIRAIVAAHPEVKWNYKEIVACYGSDMTEHALQHRFRRLRAQSFIIREARAQELDMKKMERDENNLPTTIDGIDKKNIAKYFGQSTPDGIQFQFRTIKSDAKQLVKTASSGGNVASCLDLNGGSTPTSTPKTQRSRPVAKTPSTAGGKKRTTTPVPIKRSGSDLDNEASDEEDSTDNTRDWSGIDDTPSKRPKTISATTPGQKNGTPARLAATRAGATIADASAQLHSSESSHDEIETPASASVTPTVLRQAQQTETVQPHSIFGKLAQQSSYRGAAGATVAAPAASLQNTAFSGTGRDEYFGGGESDEEHAYARHSSDMYYGDDITGEI